MVRIPLDHVSPGMVLATEARDRQGRLLLAAGQELSRRTLESLRFWGVASLDVHQDAAQAEAVVTVSPEVLGQAKDQVEARFKNAGTSHPFLDLLRSLAEERRALEIAVRGGETP